MSRARPLIAALLLLLCPALASGFEVEVELVAGEPATVLALPTGITAEMVEVEPITIELAVSDPTPQPASRTFYVAGYPVTVQPTAAKRTIRTRTARVGGREVLLVEAERLSAAGEVASVRARLRARGAPAGGWPAPVPGGWPTMLPEPEQSLVVVTTDRIAARSQQLSRYVAWRQAAGFEVIVGTEGDWDHPVAEGADRRPERIRQWLRGLRDDRGALGYVLLVGDPSPRGGSIPMQLCRPLAEVIPYYPPELAAVLDPVPTDHFYADLEGDWDADGDGRLGEYPDDRSGMRWDADALVGRIPVYRDDVEPLDRILDAIIRYESEGSPGYRRRALLPAAFIGFEGSPAPGGGEYEETNDGAVAAQVLHDAIMELDPDAEVLRFFEEEGVCPSELEHERPLTTEHLVAEWSQGAGIVAAFAHGSTDGDYRAAWLEDRNGDGVPGWEELLTDPYLTSWDTFDLEGAGRAFTFHAACENGWPEDRDNLAVSLLRSGSIGSVGASRAAIGGEAQFEPAPELGDADTMAYAFVHLLLEGATAGQAMAYLRYGLPADDWGTESGIPLGGYGWIGKLEFNLYGDPTVGLGRCSTDEQCSDGSLCNGPGRCVEGYCVQGELVDCSDLAGEQDPCMASRCDPATGGCSLVPRADGTPCDDGTYCTVDDACSEGVCVGEDRQCGEPPAGFVSVCDDLEQACLLEPETTVEPDVGPTGDGGPGDGGDDGQAFDVRGGGGCSAVAGDPRTGLPALLRLLL